MTPGVRTAVLPLLAVATLVPLVPGRTAAQVAAPPAITDHVIVISLDGFRPDAIARYPLDVLRRLLREGSSSLQARTILPSSTLPSHASMLTGTTPEVHGIDFNREQDGGPTVAVPTIFELARREGLHTAAFYSKAKFRHLDRAGAYDYWQAPRSNLDNWMATRTVADVAQYLQHERPNLLFVHVGEPDYAGHTTGWMNTFYGWAVRRADAAVGRLIEAADEAYGRDAYTVIVTADHGGHGRAHGTDHPDDITIPWIAWGRGVEPGRAPSGIRTMDTAATVLWLLGVPVPEDMAGRPVHGAFTEPVPVAADASS